MGSKTVVKAPVPTDEERALQQEQVELLRYQRDALQTQAATMDLLAPYFYEDVGLTPKFNDAGDIIGFDRQEDPLQDLRDQVEEELLNQSLASIHGELDVSPALERELSNQEQVLRERLSKQLGTGYESSTPGIETLNKFFDTAETLRESARRGQLTLSEQLGVARGQFNLGAQNQLIATQMAIPQANSQSLQQLFGVGQGYGSIVSKLQSDRQLQLQAMIANQQAQTSTMSSLYGAAGSIAGALSAGMLFA